MLIQDFEIERKEIAHFYLEYIKTHRFIKNKSIAWAFLKKKFPGIYFGKRVNYELLNILKHKFSYFCHLALENDVIYARVSHSGKAYQIKEKKKLPILEEKLKNLKNSKIKIFKKI